MMSMLQAEVYEAFRVLDVPDDKALRAAVALSAAFAKADSGAVSARAAHRLSRLTLTIANSSVAIQDPAQNGRGRGSRNTRAEIMLPSGRAMPTLWRL